MELQLFRNDIAQTATTLPGTLAVLPVGENKQQKIASGDTSGVVQVYAIKGGQLAYSYKSLPCGQKVTSLSLGKARPQRDKIFVATGSTVRGINKKGKEFFKFSTNITEALQRVDVSESHLWLSGEYVHAHFIESKEKDFFLCPDKIKGADLVPLVSSTDHTAVLACKDRMLRLMADGEVRLQAPLTHTPTCVKYVADSHDAADKLSSSKEVLVGLENGAVQQLLLSSEKVRKGFELPNARRLGSVWSLYSGIDFTKTGSSDIVVAREDGILEIYDVDEAGRLQQVYATALGESINTVDGGFIVSPVSQDCLLQTFSGKVVALSTSGMLAAPVDAISMKRMTKAGLTQEDAALKLGLEARVTRLKAELDEARAKVEEERAKIAKVTDVLMASNTTHSMVDRLRLDTEEGCYILSIESAVPIFTLALQCTLHLDLLDVPSNVAILSRSPADERAGSLTLATYRCQENTSRLHVKFRLQEGKAGTLTAYTIPQTSPKTCQVVRHQIRPLCLHQRTQKVDDTRPFSELTVSGSFSLEQMHGWMGSCLPDVPANIGRTDTEVNITFSHVLLGSMLVCKYSAGEARLRSDSFTTLSLLREALMREVTAANERVSRINFQCHATGLPHAVGLLWPKLEALRNSRRDLQLVEALKEVKLQDSNTDYLAPRLAQLLAKGDALAARAKEQPQQLAQLVALVQAMFVDYCRVAGISTPTQRLPALESLLLDTGSTQEQVLALMQARAA